jgi:peptidoglycan/LPS O-acetylase OafA/YrhL
MRATTQKRREEKRMQRSAEASRHPSQDRGIEPPHALIKRPSLLFGLWATPVVCLIGALTVNVLTSRFGWQTHLVLLAVGALAGLFALAARRLLLTPQGKAALGFVGLALLFACWIAPELGLLALGAMGIMGMLLSMAWLFKQPWDKAKVLIKNKETVMKTYNKRNAS